MFEVKILGMVQDIRNTLYDIHKCLLDYQADQTSIRLKRPLDPYDLWKLSMEDDDFRWLKNISSLIVALDEEMDLTEKLSPVDYQHIILYLKSLFFYPLPRHQDFFERVEMIKELNPDLLFLLGELLKQINMAIGPMGGEELVMDIH